MTMKVQEILQQYYDVWNGTCAVYDRWAKKQGLTTNALFILQSLHSNEGCTAHDLSERLSLPKQTVSSILNQFIKNQWVIKQDGQDHRNKELYFSQKGREFTNMLIEKLTNFESRAILKMNESQRQNLVETGKIFLEYLKETQSLD